MRQVENQKKLMLPTRNSSKPIRAYKAAYIMLINGELKFRPLSYPSGPSYGVNSEAVCPKTRQIEIHIEQNKLVNVNDTPYCVVHRCGFHGYKNMENLWEGIPMSGRPGKFLLEVDLTGTVIAHKKGYRATRQQVKKIDNLSLKCNKYNWNPNDGLQPCLKNFDVLCSSSHNNCLVLGFCIEHYEDYAQASTELYTKNFLKFPPKMTTVSLEKLQKLILEHNASL